MFGMVRYSIPAKSLWQLHVAMQSRLSHQPFAAAVAHFGALAPTPFRDSRYTFPSLGLARCCLKERFTVFTRSTSRLLGRCLEGTIVCSAQAARGNVPAIRRDRQAGCRVDVGDQRAGRLGSGVGIDDDGLDGRAGDAGERHVGSISRAASGGLAGQGDGAGDTRRDRDVRQVLVDGGLRRVGAGIDQNHLDGVGHPVDLRLKEALAAVAGDYDFVLIDCPPSLNLLTVNAMAASDAILVPLQCEFFALEGLSQLLQTVEQVRSTLNPNLSIHGIVLTMFDSRNNLSNQVVADVRQFMGSKVYNTMIPRNVRISEAPSYGKPVLVYDLKCVGSEAYLKLATEVIQRERDLRAN